jgi:2-aminoadipate transaminase
MNLENMFSNRIRDLGPSPIRELLKVARKPGIISLAGGNPAPTTFPHKELERSFLSVMEKDWMKILQYSPTEGVDELLNQVCQISRDSGIECKPEDILITTGSQQGMDLVCKAFLNPGDEVLVELPSYPGGIHTLNTYEAKLTGIPVDNNGMRVDVLEEVLEDRKKSGVMPKLIYIIPTFQNPSGVTLPEERRKEIVSLAEKYDVLVIEDDPYTSLRYEGEDIKPIKAFDKNEYVIYMSSFSKIFCPGVRVAWVIAKKEILRKMTIGKQGADLHTSSLNQAIIAEYCKNGHLKPHIEEILPFYRQKRDVMLESLEKYFSDKAKWTKPEGGFFIWLTLNDETLNARDLFTQAVDKGVVYVPGESFCVDHSNKNSLRLSFATVKNDDIKKGIKLLSEIFD